MIIPSIDIQNGRAVQLVQGRDFALDCGDPAEIAGRFSLYGDFALIDLDAATGTGSNRDLLLEIAAQYSCRVGGGIRDEATARALLDAGASKLIIGSRAEPDFLSQFPRERLMAAVDARDGVIMGQGWRVRERGTVRERLTALAPYVGAFLCTRIEREGTLGGLDLAGAAELRAILDECGFEGSLCFAGGVCSVEEIAALDRQGIDVQAGMALYTGRFSVAEAIAACLVSDRADGLWPTVVSDQNGQVLGLVYSDRESLLRACQERKGIYHSRKTGLWEKGADSGNTQELLGVRTDCDRDALLFRVRQRGSGFCHTGNRSCFDAGDHDRAENGLYAMERSVVARLDASRSGAESTGSYTARLFAEPELLAAKLLEESHEFIEASTVPELVHEAADVLYFLSVRLAVAGIGLDSVARTLAWRNRRLSRRPGNAKRAYTEQGGARWQNGLH